MIGLFKAEIIARGGPWRTLAQVELAAARRVAWWNRAGCMAPAATSRRLSSSRHTGAARRRLWPWSKPKPLSLHKTQGQEPAHTVTAPGVYQPTRPTCSPPTPPTSSSSLEATATESHLRRVADAAVWALAMASATYGLLDADGSRLALHAGG